VETRITLDHGPDQLCDYSKAID